MKATSLHQVSCPVGTFVPATTATGGSIITEASILAIHTWRRLRFVVVVTNVVATHAMDTGREGRERTRGGDDIWRQELQTQHISY